MVVYNKNASTHFLHTTIQKHTIMNTNDNKDSPTVAAIKLIGGKWKLCILWQLSLEKKRFGELQRSIRGITQQMLSKQLKEMEKDKLINRKVYEVIPPKVEYSLTTYGKSGIPVLTNLCEWANKSTK